MEHYPKPNNIPPNVLPMMHPMHYPVNPMPNINVLEVEQKTENIYFHPHYKHHFMYPVYPPVVRPICMDATIILVLFILLVIVSRGSFFR